MTRLNTTQIQALEHILHQREQQLQQEIAAVHAENAQQAQALEDLPPEPDANQSGASAAREVRHAERMRDQQELHDVRAALQRIADDSYGTRSPEAPSGMTLAWQPQRTTGTLDTDSLPFRWAACF